MMVFFAFLLLVAGDQWSKSTLQNEVLIGERKAVLVRSNGNCGEIVENSLAVQARR